MTASHDELFRKGVDLFNEGDYHEAHEFWEDIWREEPDPGRLFYQGLIQICAALLHREWGHARGSGNHVRRATEKLRRFAPSHRGVDVAALLDRIDAIFPEGLPPKHLGEKLPSELRPEIRYLEPGQAWNPAGSPPQ